MKMTRMTLVAVSLAVCSFTVQAGDNRAVPSPSRDPVVQQLKLSDEQVTKIKHLHNQLIDKIRQIPLNDVKDDVLIDVIQSGKWDVSAVKKQLAALGQIQEKTRYYRVKYYFDVSQVLTPEQRKQVKADMAVALK
ncbi:Spy/CpxP family protein refolding chaperone [Enterobacter mori]